MKIVKLKLNTLSHVKTPEDFYHVLLGRWLRLNPFEDAPSLAIWMATMMHKQLIQPARVMLDVTDNILVVQQ